MKAALAILFSAAMVSISVQAEEIGSVSTVWKLVGPNHKIIVEVFDDPDIPNVSCWVSRPKTGGISGAVGLAEDPSYGSIACRRCWRLSTLARTPPLPFFRARSGGRLCSASTGSASGRREDVPTSAWLGEDNRLLRQCEVPVPHSLGLLYSIFTEYCGFKANSGEYKLMGLAPMVSRSTSI